jgi:hypothetical protein
MKTRIQVGGHRHAPLLEIQSFESAAREDTRAVQQAGQRTPSHRPANFGTSKTDSYIGLDPDNLPRPERRGLRKSFGVAADSDHLGTGAGQSHRGRAADPSARSGHQK